MALNKDLLDLLACPRCKGEVKITPDEKGLYCAACGVIYPIRDDIPIMLVEEAVPVEKWTSAKPAEADEGSKK